MNNLSHKPKQYQQGWTDFFKLKFKVTPDVLIPRPETEILVEEVLNRLKNLESRITDKITILDIGTGSGCIAISIAKSLSEQSSVQIIATDISDSALEIAQLNAKLHGVNQKINFIQSDLLNNNTLTSLIHNSKFLILAANLPYIPASRIPKLDPSVKNFEPHLALNGGKNGFNLYKRLFQQIKDNNIQPILIICEIDSTHKKVASKEAGNYFPKATIDVKNDLARLPRVLVIKYNII